ncbi:HupE/UreJ family protein [Paenibacillus psychroresistens]|uniref:HupE/UreJ family protein n=1 Tax=Paenibacillus psychroresistens TaxID=1778678 RepID=A0A6B8RFE4_9BACL|nr:HupE/UreJ family protein [Paenibacillus psychroresistens]QGQ94657.1 HupE/UreJ family protein [Paenibacillus psychroresistens]
MSSCRKVSLGAAVWLLFMMLFSISINTVYAHFQTFAYSEISIENKTIHYTLLLDPYEVVIRYPDLDANSNGYVESEEVANLQNNLFEYVKSNLSVINEKVAGIPELKEVRLEDRKKIPMLRFDLEYPFSKPIGNFEIEYSFFFQDTDPQHQNFVTIVKGDKTVEKIIDKEHNILTNEVFGMNEITVSIPNWTSILLRYMSLGMEHIWSGIDHMLFLAVLIIGGGSKREYLKILTAFTLGHCITLGLSVMEVVVISPKIIEPLIALSIIYVAVENIIWKRLQWRWLVTLIFGLIHGFGFSYILQGMLTSHFALSLVSFNLGVEIGQIVVLAVLLPLVWYLAKKKWLLKTSYGISGIVGAIGVFWFIERVL